MNEKKKQVKRYAAPSTIALLTMDERKRGHFYLMKLITTPIPTAQNVCLLRMLEIECSSLHSHYCFGCRLGAVSCAHFATATYIRFTASFLALLVLPTAWAHRTNITHTHFTYGSSLIRLQLYIYSLVWTEYGNRSNFLFTMYNAYTSVAVVVAVLDSQLLLNFRHSYFPLRFRCFIHIIRSFILFLCPCVSFSLFRIHILSPVLSFIAEFCFFPLSIVFFYPLRCCCFFFSFCIVFD